MLTSIDFAAYRGDTEMVRALLDKSAANEEEEDEKEEARREARRAAAKKPQPNNADTTPFVEADSDDDDAEEIDLEDDDSLDDVTEGSSSFVKLSDKEKEVVIEDDAEGPDVFYVDVLAWDNPLSPLHLAIISGKVQVIKLLCDEYGADVLLPVKILSRHDRTPESAILTLILALELPLAEARKTIDALLALGALGTQADMKQVSALHYAINDAKPVILDAFKRGSDAGALSKAMNFLVASQGSPYGWYNKSVNSCLLSAIRTRQAEMVDAVLKMGAEPQISLEAYSAVYHREEARPSADTDEVAKIWRENIDQPVIVAAKMEMPDVVSRLIDEGADVNVATKDSYQSLRYSWRHERLTLLDVVRDRVKDLRESIEEKPVKKLTLPVKLGPDEKYLAFDRDSYKYWKASHDLTHAKHVESYLLSEYEKSTKANDPEPVDGKLEKIAAIEAVIVKYEALERKLVQAGAKTFTRKFDIFLSFLLSCLQWWALQWLLAILLSRS